MSGKVVKPTRPVGAPSRIKALPALLGFVLVAAISLALSLPGVLAFVRAVAIHAPLVAFTPRDAVGLPLAMAFLALGAITLSTPTLPGRQRPSANDRSRVRNARYTTACITIAFACILVTIMTIPVAEIAASVALADKGYTRCPLLPGERHAPMRWVSPDGHCPRPDG